MKKVYIAGYHQSAFGKLLGMTVPEIIDGAVTGVCSEIGVTPERLDVASIGATCNISLNRQGLLAGLVAEVPGMEGKPIEFVENACASGGQAILSVVQKLQCGLGETGVAIGYEKMRDGSGKADGKLVGEVLGYYTHPDERGGKVLVAPHQFAEIMQAYIEAYGATEEDFARIAVSEYANAEHNPWAQMKNVRVTLDQATRIEGSNRYVVPGLPLKTYDCSQITDGYAAIILATEEGVARLGVPKESCVELAGYAQATDPLRKAGRDVLKPAGAYRAMKRAYEMAGLTPADIQVAELHDCFTIMAAVGTEVLGLAEPGGGTAYWRDGKAAVNGTCALNTSGGLIAKGHPVGATGISMVGWCSWQLLGSAPEPLQVENARAAATFNIGGPVCASVCTVLKRIE
ncbi:MAG: thiolase family protein [Thermoanaerobaculia bacterium]|nr:thiolase family protein [Thermoanaerobaculia bacterium]